MHKNKPHSGHNTSLSLITLQEILENSTLQQRYGTITQINCSEQNMIMGSIQNVFMSLVRKLNALNCTEIKLCIFSVLKKAFAVIIQNKNHQRETFWELWTSLTSGNRQLMGNRLISGKVHNIHRINISLQKMLNKFQEDLPLGHWSETT